MLIIRKGVIHRFLIPGLFLYQNDEEIRADLTNKLAILVHNREHSQSLFDSTSDFIYSWNIGKRVRILNHDHFRPNFPVALRNATSKHRYLLSS